MPTVSKRFCVKRQELFLRLAFLEEFKGRKKKAQFFKKIDNRVVFPINLEHDFSFFLFFFASLFFFFASLLVIFLTSRLLSIIIWWQHSEIHTTRELQGAPRSTLGHWNIIFFLSFYRNIKIEYIWFLNKGELSQKYADVPVSLPSATCAVYPLETCTWNFVSPV